MSRLIVISGRGRRGKTTLIKEIINELLCRKADIIDEKPGNSTDTWCVLEYKGNIIGITTRGDTEKCIKDDFDAIDKRAKRSVEVYVCASRSKGNTLNYIQQFAQKKGASITIFEKGDVERFDDKDKGLKIAQVRYALNKVQAELIVNSSM